MAGRLAGTGSVTLTRTFLGAGIGLRAAHLAALQERDARESAVLELTPSHFFAAPELLERVAEDRTIVLHDVFASLGTAAPLDLAHLDRVAAVAQRSAAVAYTEHLAMTRSPAGLDLGHLIPLPRTRAQLEVLIEHIHVVQDRLSLPVALELPTTTLTLTCDAELSEGEFVTALVEASACELVLDLENLCIDAHNFPTTPTMRVADRLAALPLAAVSHVHLAGGHTSGAWVIDSHAAPVSEDCYAWLAALRGRITPRTIIVERDANMPGLDDLLDEASRAAAIWRGGPHVL